jgi:hypothetical protein
MLEGFDHDDESAPTDWTWDTRLIALAMIAFVVFLAGYLGYVLATTT